MNFIANLGFPIAVAAFVLVRIEPMLKEMNESLILLTVYVKKKGNVSNDDFIRLQHKIDQR